MKKAVKATMMRSPPHKGIEVSFEDSPIIDPLYILSENESPRTVNCRKTCFTQYWGRKYTTSLSMGKKEPDANIKAISSIMPNPFAAWGVLMRLAMINPKPNHTDAIDHPNEIGNEEHVQFHMRHRKPHIQIGK